jgi:phosphoribosylanthranilate isomerase
MFIKICGITTPRQIDWALELGYDAIGFVLYEKSKRYLHQDAFEGLARYAKGKIKTVAVSKDFADLTDAADLVDYVQFYKGSGFENLEDNKIILSGDKIFSDKNFSYFIYDLSCGSGEFKDFPESFDIPKDKLILSGGLNSENVYQVIKKYRPFGVDVSSGVENQEGKKDFNLMKEFIKEVRKAYD